MSKSKIYSTQIYVRPAVARWIASTFPEIDGRYDMRKDSLYGIIQNGLYRKDIKMPNKYYKKILNYVPIRLIIHEWDFYNFGWQIPTFAQTRISQLLFDIMMDKFCNHIAFAYAYSKQPRDDTIKRIMVEYLFDEDEINHYYIQKYYQRKFQNTGKEQQIIDFVKFTNFDLTQS